MNKNCWFAWFCDSAMRVSAERASFWFSPCVCVCALVLFLFFFCCSVCTVVVGTLLGLHMCRARWKVLRSPIGDAFGSGRQHAHIDSGEQFAWLPSCMVNINTDDDPRSHFIRHQRANERMVDTFWQWITFQFRHCQLKIPFLLPACSTTQQCSLCIYLWLSARSRACVCVCVAIFETFRTIEPCILHISRV